MTEFISDALQRYFWFINERHAIYLAKQAGEPWPWTTDKILQIYKFTNVFRELDTETIWLRKNWLEPYANDPALYLNIAMFRQFGWSPTMGLIGYVTEDDWDPDRLTAIVEEYQRNGNKVFTGAYMIRGQCINPSGTRWTSKAQYMFHKVLNPLWQTDEPEWTTLEAAHKWFMQFEGFGPFMSYEVVTDMRHTSYLDQAPDIMTWANPGPGAMRGIRRLLGVYHQKYFMSQTDYIDCMRLLLSLSPEYLANYVPSLELRDIEHTLCEYDKYERVAAGEGRPRSKYTPPTGK